MSAEGSNDPQVVPYTESIGPEGKHARHFFSSAGIHSAIELTPERDLTDQWALLHACGMGRRLWR